MTDIEKIKKSADAQKDIDKINELLIDSSHSFHKRANSLYEDIEKNSDYAPYIAMAKVGRKMGGNIPFSQLQFIPKRNVLVMTRDAIEMYKIKTAAEQND